MNYSNLTMNKMQLNAAIEDAKEYLDKNLSILDKGMEYLTKENPAMSEDDKMQAIFRAFVETSLGRSMIWGVDPVIMDEEARRDKWEETAWELRYYMRNNRTAPTERIKKLLKKFDNEFLKARIKEASHNRVAEKTDAFFNEFGARGEDELPAYEIEEEEEKDKTLQLLMDSKNVLQDLEKELELAKSEYYLEKIIPLEEAIKESKDFIASLEKGRTDHDPKECKLHLLVVGSRSITDEDFVKSNLVKIINDLGIKDFKEVEIISGGADGVDTLAKEFAIEHCCAYTEFLAQWTKYDEERRCVITDRSAGYKRNAEMHKYVSQYENRKCVVFWDGKSKGTQHSFKLAVQYGTEIIDFRPEEV